MAIINEGPVERETSTLPLWPNEQKSNISDGQIIDSQDSVARNEPAIPEEPALEHIDSGIPTSEPVSSRKKTLVIAAGGAAALLAVGAAFFVGKDSGKNAPSKLQSSVEAAPQATSTTEVSQSQTGEITARRFTGDKLQLPGIQDPSNPQKAAQSALDLMGCYFATLDNACLAPFQPAGNLTAITNIGKQINVFDQNGRNYRDDQQFLFFPDPNNPPQFDVVSSTPDSTTIKLVGGRELYTNVLSDGYPWGYKTLIEKSPAEGLLDRFTVTITRKDNGWVVTAFDFYLGNNTDGNPYSAGD